jgi:tetratricopeptide (TPR) repeat protein
MEEPTPPAADDTVVSGAVTEDVSERADTAATLPESEAVPPQPTDAAVSPSKPQEKAYQLLAAAREAYWLRDYDIAESKYRALTRVEPDNPDGYGELGNMYFSQGQWDEAATAYYEAGVRLVGQGLLEQAEELVAVIRGLNSIHADDLELKIKEARSAAD